MMIFQCFHGTYNRPCSIIEAAIVECLFMVNVQWKMQYTEIRKALKCACH